MEKYVFYYKGDDIQTFPKATLSKKFKAELTESGFKKHPFEVMADNVATALTQLKRDNESNLSALSDFSGNILIIAAIFIPSFIVIISVMFFYH